MGACMKQTTVAVLMHEDSQWTDALRTIKTLMENGSAVILFYLGFAPMTIENPMPDDPCLECYADVCQMGMDCMSLNEIAERLRQCDLVIPI